MSTNTNLLDMEDNHENENEGEIRQESATTSG